MARNIYPSMVQVSRDCGYTRQLHTLLMAKLSEPELHILEEWLKIVYQENQMDVNRQKRKNMFGLR